AAAFQIAGAANMAAEEARRAGMDEANARRVAAGEALLAISRRLAGQAVAAGIEAAVAFASYRYGEGVRQTIVAGIYGAGAGTLFATGRQLVASGRGSASGGNPFAKPSISRPAAPSGGAGSRPDGEIPASDIPTGTTSDRNNPQSTKPSDVKGASNK